MNLKSSGSILITSIIAVTGSAHAATLSVEQIQKVIQDKATCDAHKASDSVNCNETDGLFDQLKDSKNVQMIYKIYFQQNVQMEMEYSGHTGG